MEVPVTKRPLAVSGKAEELAHPDQDLALDLDGHVIASAEIGIEPRGQHLRQHAHRRAAAMDPAHEAGMGIAGGERHYVRHESPMGLGEARRRMRQRLTKASPRLLGNWLPDRPRLDALEVVEDVVQHAMALSAEARPVHGIEVLVAREIGFGHGGPDSCGQLLSPLPRFEAGEGGAHGEAVGG